MEKFWASIGSAIFFIVAPGTILGLIPWWLSHWRFEPAFFGQDWLRIVGAILIAAGLISLINSFVRFALEGLGTPAPIAPPRHLVVTGFYRHVRNPMYVGLVSVVIGEALLFGSVQLLWYAALAWLFFHIWVLVIEEPVLTSQFEDTYREFRTHVPRWLPRITPWRGA